MQCLLKPSSKQTKIGPCNTLRLTISNTANVLRATYNEDCQNVKITVYVLDTKSVFESKFLIK